MTTVQDLFHIGHGHSMSLNKMEKVENATGIAFVSRTSRNNGVAAWVAPVDGVAPQSAGSLTVCLRSRNHALATFVQPRRFYTAYHVAILTPREPMTQIEKLWWARCIEQNRYRYNFGRQANRTLKRLELPEEKPAWFYNTEMPAYGELTLSDVAEEEVAAVMSPSAPFAIGHLFAVGRGENVLKREMVSGKTPYVGASGVNNGVTAWIDRVADWPAGCVTIASNGDVGAAFYQAQPFCASSDVTILQPLFEATPQDLLFFVTIVRMEKFRWNYGRKWSSSRIVGTHLRLPVDKSGEVNWAGIRTFMSRFPLASVVT